MREVFGGALSRGNLIDAGGAAAVWRPKEAAGQPPGLLLASAFLELNRVRNQHSVSVFNFSYRNNFENTVKSIELQVNIYI